LQKARGQEWTVAGLKQLLRLDESIVCIVGFFRWLFASANDLYAWKELTQIVHESLSDLKVNVRNILVTVGAGH